MSLTPENSEYLANQVAAGLFPSQDAAINAAIELHRRRSNLLAHLKAGIAQLDANNSFEFDDSQLDAYFAELIAPSNGATAQS